MGRGFISRSTMDSPKLELIGNDRIHVSASAYIQDTRPNMSYIWAVRFLDREDRKKVLEEILYEDQQFLLPPELELYPTFDDTLDVPAPPGSFVVEVVFYELPIEAKVDVLRDPVKAANFRGSYGVAQVPLN